MCFMCLEFSKLVFKSFCFIGMRKRRLAPCGDGRQKICLCAHIIYQTTMHIVVTTNRNKRVAYCHFPNKQYLSHLLPENPLLFAITGISSLFRCHPLHSKCPPGENSISFPQSWAQIETKNFFCKRMGSHLSGGGGEPSK